MVAQIFEVCLIPLLGILTKYIVDYLNAKREEINQNTKNETEKKYKEMIFDTVAKCVITTNQTYVNALKANGQFDEDAQIKAFNKTADAVMAILTDDLKDYIKETTGDLNAYLTSLIETEVNKNRK